jgi:RTT107 (Regulator of Ty1 Transposition protein 107)-like protein
VYIIDEPSPSGFVLCAPRIGRTRKFLCALAYGPKILSTAFLDHVLEQKGIPDFDDYLFNDKDGESKLDVDIEASLSRAQENNRKLLKGWQIFCTERIAGGFDTYKAIIEANGGSCLLFKNKTNMSISKRMLNTEIPAANQDDDENRLYLISGNSKEEVALWEPFKKMAEKANMEPMIVKKEWLLAVAMNQTIAWRDEWGH